MDILETNRTQLRRFNSHDLDSMISLESDPEVMKFTSYRLVQTKEQTEQRLQKLIQKKESYFPLGVWACEEKLTGQFIGWFMLVKTDSDIPELGFMLTKNFWGMGFGTEVAKKLIEFGTQDLQYTQIKARTDQENKASIHILLKCGFYLQEQSDKFDPHLNQMIRQNTYLYSL